jgi:hypothetical protein
VSKSASNPALSNTYWTQELLWLKKNKRFQQFVYGHQPAFTAVYERLHVCIGCLVTAKINAAQCQAIDFAGSRRVSGSI